MAEILSHINSWSKEAKCRGNIDDTKFFGPSHATNTNGKKFCTGCPVENQCRTYAIVHNLEGIWGGTTLKERQDLGPLVKEFLIQTYEEFGLLDHFLTQVATGLEGELPQILQSEPFSPTVDPVPSWDSSLDLSA